MHSYVTSSSAESHVRSCPSLLAVPEGGAELSAGRASPPNSVHLVSWALKPCCSEHTRLLGEPTPVISAVSLGVPITTCVPGLCGLTLTWPPWLPLSDVPGTFTPFHLSLSLPVSLKGLS